MSYAVLHIIKANSSLNSIAKHIERTAHPENADPARTHLNRYNLVEYPDGITGLAAAVEHRISNAGITRKISDRQVRCLNLVMTSDNEGMQKIIDSGKLDEWIADNIKWARDTFGSDNVVGAALHMDERTPHLHIAVVPIVTAERKKKAREATAKKRYRTKAANRPRLCADDIMERGKMSRYQDIYAEAMAKYGLERGIRGSEARHIGQHEYYRDCMVKKKGLEEDIGNLSIEKRKLDKEKKSLESKVENLECRTTALDSRKKMLTQVNEEIRQRNNELCSENTRLTEANSSLAAENKSLADTNAGLSEESVRLAEQRKGLAEDTDRLTAEKKAYEAQTDEARKEARNAIRERDEAKAERDAQRKELGSNIANIFTGSKTKRLEAEIVRKDNEIREMKDRAEARERDLHREISNLSDSLRRQNEHEADTVRSYEWKMGNFVKFFPDAVAMLPAIEECQDVGLNDSSIKGLLSLNEYVLKSGMTLYYPFQRREVDASGAKVQIKRDPTDNKFHLHVNGTRIFQWLKDQWQRLTQTVKRGFGIT
ncbi:MobV family relaxase [Duncaniella muris]|uniref:MobV family relaxase n=1 Tax=Duncaniella muris TaxID=2094150 RepID=UPI00262F9E0E|nr:MobV family relaxase [Duncaniella muris]